MFKSFSAFKFGALIIVMLFLIGAGGCQKTKTAATVNDINITQDELYKELDRRFGKQTLDDMIVQKLIQQKAEKDKLLVEDGEVNKKLEEIKKLLPGGELEPLLKERNTSVDDFKKDLKLNLTLRKLAAGSLTEEDKKGFYEKNKERLAQVEASHILVKTKEEADSILKELKEGKDFAALAQKHSLDPQSKPKGGYLGPFSHGVMDPAFEKGAFETKVGEISDVIKSNFGFHIIKVVSKKITYGELKEKVEDEMLQQNNNEKIRNFINNLKEGAKIVYDSAYSKPTPTKPQ